MAVAVSAEGCVEGGQLVAFEVGCTTCLLGPEERRAEAEAVWWGMQRRELRSFAQDRRWK